MKSFFGPRKSGIIFAADMASFEENAAVLDKVADTVDVIKINVPLVMRESPNVITRLRDRFDLPVFADVKVADVPHTCQAIVTIMREVGASAVMVHGIVGPDALQDCIDAAQGELGIIVQLELTNPGGEMFTQPIAEDMATMASVLDIYGVQAPGNRPDRVKAIRQAVGDDKVIVCCGVGAQGGTYSSVMNSGGNYAIIGRAIYNSDNPGAAVTRILSADE